MLEHWLLTPFNQTVIRNTPMLTELDDGVLSDLIDDNFDLDVVKKTMNKQNQNIRQKTVRQAIDFVFEQDSVLKSRFSDGSFPVWYASLDQETTCHETAFHWYQSILQDFDHGEQSVTTNRSIFSVGCDALLVDLRPCVKQIPALTDKSIDAYQETNLLSKSIHRQGQTGLFTYSARKDKGENIAVFKRSVLGDVNHLHDIQYIFDIQNSLIHVLDKKSQKVIFEIS